MTTATQDTINAATATSARRIGRRPVPPVERFWPKVDKGSLPDSCWNWLGAKIKGYGYFSYDGKQGKAYRFAYELIVGPIPEGLTIDHLCKNPSCVNPAHLEPVTQAVNLARSDRTRPNNGEHNRIKMHCPAGHEYTEANTGHDKSDGGRYCRTCKREQSRRRRSRAA